MTRGLRVTSTRPGRRQAMRSPSCPTVTGLGVVSPTATSTRFAPAGRPFGASLTARRVEHSGMVAGRLGIACWITPPGRATRPTGVFIVPAAAASRSRPLTSIARNLRTARPPTSLGSQAGLPLGRATVETSRRLRRSWRGSAGAGRRSGWRNRALTSGRRRVGAIALVPDGGYVYMANGHDSAGSSSRCDVTAATSGNLTSYNAECWTRSTSPNRSRSVSEPRRHARSMAGSSSRSASRPARSIRWCWRSTAGRTACTATLLHEFQVLAARGYVVLYTNPHGSTGYGDAFAGELFRDWGEARLSRPDGRGRLGDRAGIVDERASA